MSVHHLCSSPVMVDAPMKQGIVTVLLRSDSENRKEASIRTFSADMSSKVWLEQNSLKKISSSQELVIGPDSSSSESEDNKNSKKLNSWGSLIVTQKSENINSSINVPLPYVHPQVKRSAGTLSKKSLEICTENLGSETGSEFSSDIDEDEEAKKRVHEREEIRHVNYFEDLYVDKYKKSVVRSFPPPLPSIGGGHGGSLHMQHHRVSGRLVLEAVPTKNSFHAQRGEGRFVLTLVNSLNSLEKENKDDFGEVFDKMEEVGKYSDDEEKVDDVGDDDNYEDDEDMEEDEEEEEGKVGGKNVNKELKFVMGQNIISRGMINVSKSRLVIKKGNPVWSESDPDEELAAPQSLPPLVRVAQLVPSLSPATATSLSGYKYFSQNKNTATSFINPVITNPQSNGTNAYTHQDLVIMRENKEEHFVPYFRGCMEGKRSLLAWEPHCIATS